jgi:hypothetical protein
MQMSVLDDMRGHDALAYANSEQSLSARALKQLADHFEITVPFGRNDPEYGLPWLNEQLLLPMYLSSRRVYVDPERLFKKLVGSKLWKAYMELMEEVDRPLVGLITPAFGTKLHIIHNDHTIPPIPSCPRLVMTSLDETKGIIFESVESYMQSTSKLRAT